MLKLLSKVFLSILILSSGITLNAQEFDPTKVSQETEAFIREAIKELDPNGDHLGKSLNIYPIEMSRDYASSNINSDNYLRFLGLKMDAPTSTVTTIFVDEKMFNKLSFDEKRFFIFERITYQKIYKAKYLKMLKIVEDKPIPPIHVPAIAVGGIMATIIEMEIKRAFERFKKELNEKFLDELNNDLALEVANSDFSAGFIIYLKRLLKLVEEKKVTGIYKVQVVGDIEKIENAKKNKI